MNAARAQAERALEGWQPDVDGPWDAAQAAHLLRRVCFGGTPAERAQVLAWGPQRAVTELASCPPLPDDYASTLAALQPLSSSDNLGVQQALWLTRMLRDPHPFREQLALFWHGHFATSVSKVGRVQLLAAQVDMLRERGPGPFGALLSAVSRDPAMIIWLDGNANRRLHANENYARELFELFGLGVGHYTEHDVLEAARAFTGWHEHEGRFRFDAHEHDAGEKLVLGRRGALDGDDVLAAVLEQPACARHVGGRLFRYFVHPDPSQELLEVIGERYRASGCDTLALVRTFLASREFFGTQSRRALIKSPVALAVGAARTLGLRPDTTALAERLAALGQSLYAPPSVKGWDGGRAWLNAATLVGRFNLAAELARALPEAPVGPALRPRDGRADLSALVELLLDGQAPTAAQEVLADAQPDVRTAVHVLLSLPEAQLA